MGPLIVQCPKTRATIDTGVATNYKSLAESWNRTVSISCPHCGAEHEVKVRDAFIRGELSLLTLRGA
jgi:hypothetical protein